MLMLWMQLLLMSTLLVFTTTIRTRREKVCGILERISGPVTLEIVCLGMVFDCY